MKESKKINKEELLDGIKYCKKNVRNILNVAELLIDNNEIINLGIIYSLWTYAMEEYGKFLYLYEKLNRSNNCNEYCLPNWLFRGFCGHEKKFNKAKEKLNGLPSKIRCDVHISSNVSNTTRGLENENIGNIVIGPYQTGIKEDTSNLGGRSLNIELRYISLFVDWDDKNRKWIYPELILSEGEVKANEILNSDDLKKCIKILKDDISRPILYKQTDLNLF
ncbi:MAG: hypothetical protein AAB596_02250 [Patescibacteria group bacterium]